MRTICATATSVALFVAACGDNSEDASPATTEERDEAAEVDETTTTTEAETTTTEAETTTTTEAPAAPGSRDNPVPAATPATVGEWEVMFAPTNRDATQAIMTENEFNEPPAEGRVFGMAEVTVTYIGDQSGTPWLDLYFDFVDAAGNTGGTGEEDYCGVIPNDLDEVGEMFAGASGSGNVCAVVAADQIDGGAWIVEDFVSFDDTRVFLGLEGQ